ncbi:MAG: thermonuclease family protein [Myxococcota bacterium]
MQRPPMVWMLGVGVVICCGTAELSVHVHRVVDGDTFESGETRVRLWAIDAPESHACWGEVATRALRGRIEGMQVILRIPPKPAPELDAYGRRIREVLLEGRSINLALLREGHAWPSGPVAPHWARAARAAKSAGKGGWGACGWDHPIR